MISFLYYSILQWSFWCTQLGYNPVFWWKELNLLDTPPRSNWNTLVCLPNRLFDSALNLMNVFKASNFLCTRYTYTNLEYSLTEVMKHPYYSYVWTLKVPNISICTKLKNSLVLCSSTIKSLLVILHLYMIHILEDSLES